MIVSRFALVAAALALAACANTAENPNPRDVGENTALGADGEPGKVEIGTLTCELDSSTNLIVYSTESFDCTFDGIEGLNEKYSGQLTALGADLQYKTAQTLKWIVVAPAVMQDPGLLEGEYAGASAEVAAGYGAGAKVLIGGSEDQFALQPVSVSGSEGIGVALTLENLSLTYNGMSPQM